MKIKLDYTNVHLYSSDMESIVEWGKKGPIVFSNHKLRKVHNYDIDEMVEEVGFDDVLDFLGDIKEHYNSKYHQMQIDEVIEYVNDKKGK